MEGKFIHVLKFEKPNAHRNCPLCGREIEYRMYPAEIAVRVLTIAAFVIGAYFAHGRIHGFFTPLLIALAVVVASHAAVILMLRNGQRFQKGRHAR